MLLAYRNSHGDRVSMRAIGINYTVTTDRQIKLHIRYDREPPPNWYDGYTAPSERLASIWIDPEDLVSVVPA